MNFLAAAQNEHLPLQTDVPLAPYTNWKIGGPAKFFATVKSVQELRDTVKLARKFQEQIFLLGGGTNILVADEGFPGLVIKMELNNIRVAGESVVAQAGAAMGKTAATAMQHNLQGLEWAVGIPGTVGGAVFGNSNCFSGSTAETLSSILLMTLDGTLQEKDKEYLQFGYDYSALSQTGEIVVEARFQLKKADPKTMAGLKQKILAAAASRFEAQPLGEKTAGSTFKALVPTIRLTAKLESQGLNWKNALRDNFISAGFIIDKCLGLKGYTLENMKISEKHANFFVNSGGATAKNAKALIDFVKKECKNKLGENLEEEIRYVGNF